MKAKVIKRFRNKYDKQKDGLGKLYTKDSEFEGSKERIKELASIGYVEFPKEETSLLDGNVNEVKGNITSDLSEEELQELLQKETEGKDRTGVKNHIEDVLKEKEQPPDEEGE